jgi:hypothetical protein
MAFRTHARDCLTEDERDRETHRTIILALAGFSFTGLLALVVLEGALQQGLSVAIYCLLISFVSFIVSLNLQSYKFRYWHDQLGTAFIDAGTLALILSVLSILFTPHYDPLFATALSALALTAWVADHIIRLSLEVRIMRRLPTKEK